MQLIYIIDLSLIYAKTGNLNSESFIISNIFIYFLCVWHKWSLCLHQCMLQILKLCNATLIYYILYSIHLFVFHEKLLWSVANEKYDFLIYLHYMWSFCDDACNNDTILILYLILNMKQWKRIYKCRTIPGLNPLKFPVSTSIWNNDQSKQLSSLVSMLIQNVI